jgi:hypothetical protein
LRGDNFSKSIGEIFMTKPSRGASIALAIGALGLLVIAAFYYFGKATVAGIFFGLAALIFFCLAVFLFNRSQ